MDEKLIAALRRIGEVRLDEPLSRHTTFGIGGPADAFVTVDSARRLRRLVALCHRHDTPLFILGAGSNILVGELGIRGVTAENRARQVQGPKASSNGRSVFRIESGMPLAKLARDLSAKGFSGLEWAGGIPGTIGGAVVYNAGAYECSLADVLKRVGMVDARGRGHILSAADLGLGYRESAFTRRLFAGQVILWAEIGLFPGDPDDLVRQMREFDRSRSESQPRGRSAGSIFKNTREYPAWWLIDQVGLRGYRIGDAEISEKHPNFILNVGKARASDVKALMELAQERVLAEFAVKLQPEVALVGEGF
ncbi:MAG: UDP-N-acetylmuramate dehydrogenase [Dehalococcoidia bacterium]|nr:UDP-N-acetylmuramate dehydrogenase [Dehalococcoidia bacterium]